MNPTIPLCIVCGKPKNEVALLGAAGDQLARLLGHRDGAMPMYAHLPGDLEPCDECKKRGITIIEAEDRHPTGRLWLVEEDAFRRCCNADDENSRRILERRVCMMPREDARRVFGAAYDKEKTGDGAK